MQSLVLSDESRKAKNGCDRAQFILKQKRLNSFSKPMAKRIQACFTPTNNRMINGPLTRYRGLLDATRRN